MNRHPNSPYVHAAFSWTAALVLLLSGCTAAPQEDTPTTEAPTATPTQSRPTPTPFPTLTPTPLTTPTAGASPTPSAPAGVPTATPDPTGGAPITDKLLPYKDPELGFEVSYPESWDPLPGDLSAGEPLFYAEWELGLPRMFIDVAYPSELGTVEQHAKEALAEFGATPKVLAEGPVKQPDGAAGYYYHLETTVQNLTFGTRLVVLTKGSRVYRLVAQTIRGDLEGRLPQLRSITDSFKATQPVVFGVSRENAFTILMPGPSTLDPHLLSDAGSYNYAIQIFSGLVTLDKELKVAPDLAERWDVSADGKTYTFHLRNNAKFHSGRAVTAADILWSLERATAKDTRSRTASLYLDDIAGVTEKLAGTANSITGIKVVDPATFQVQIKEPVPYFLSKLTYPVAYVVDKDNVTKDPQTWFAKPNGTGPFKLRGWSIDVAVVLDRNDAYYRTPPGVPHVLIWNFGPNPLGMYFAGEIDVAPLFSTELDLARKPGSATAAQVVETSELTVNYLGFNVRRAPFDDPRARLAFLLASDVGKVVKEDLKGLVTLASGIMPTGLPGHNPELKPSFDPTRAKTLWDQYVKEKGDSAKTVKFLVQGLRLPADIAALRTQWETTLGVKIEFAGTGTSDLDRALEQTQSNLFSYGWIADYPDPQNFLDVLFHSRSVNNHGLYKNAAFDKLLEQARVEPSATRRYQLYRQAEVMLLEDAGAIPLYFGRNYNLVGAGVRGWFLSPQNVPDLSAVTVTRTLTPAGTAA